MRKSYQGTGSQSKQKFEVLGNGKVLVEMALPIGVGRTAGPSRAVDGARGAADYRHDSRGGSRAAGRSAAPAGSGVELCALGTAARLCGVWRAEGVDPPAPGVRARRRRSSIGQLRPTVARRTAAACGAGRDRRRADDAELSPSSGLGAGWLRDREGQRQSGIR